MSSLFMFAHTCASARTSQQQALRLARAWLVGAYSDREIRETGLSRMELVSSTQPLRLGARYRADPSPDVERIWTVTKGGTVSPQVDAVQDQEIDNAE